MSYVLTLNGVQYDKLRVLSITRSFQVLDTDNTGRVISGDMDRDVIGTFYNYTLELERTADGLAQYDAFYEVISDPNLAFHSILVPYAQTEFTFLAYVTSGEDTLIVRDNGNNWNGLSISFTAKSPKRRAL